MHDELKKRANKIIRSKPDLVQDGLSRYWVKVFTLGGVPYCKINGKLRPVTFHEGRKVYIALPLSLSPKMSRYLA